MINKNVVVINCYTLFVNVDDAMINLVFRDVGCPFGSLTTLIILLYIQRTLFVFFTIKYQ